MSSSLRHTAPAPSVRLPARLRSGALRCGMLLACLLLALPAAADWLVTREGGRVETRGAWEVKGRLVVFTTADGQLSSLRLDDVDLEASRRATAEAEAAAEGDGPTEPEREAPRPPRRKITDADIPPGESGRAPAAAGANSETGAEEADGGANGGGGAAGEGETLTGPPAANLAVVTSEGEPAEDGHLRVRGILANQGSDTAVGVRLTVHLYGFDGEQLGSAEARLQSTALQPGQTATFMATFPEVFAYAAMSFEPRGVSLLTASDAEPADEGQAPQPGTSSP